jgi:phosphomannomutase
MKQKWQTENSLYGRSIKMKKTSVIKTALLTIFLVPMLALSQQAAEVTATNDEAMAEIQTKYVISFKVDGESVESWAVPRENESEKVEVIPGNHEIDIKLVQDMNGESAVVFHDVVKFRAEAGHTYWLRASGEENLEFYVKDVTDDLFMTEGS